MMPWTPGYCFALTRQVVGVCCDTGLRGHGLASSRNSGPQVHELLDCWCILGGWADLRLGEPVAAFHNRVRQVLFG